MPPSFLLSSAEEGASLGFSAFFFRRDEETAYLSAFLFPSSVLSLLSLLPPPPLSEGRLAFNCKNRETDAYGVKKCPTDGEVLCTLPLNLYNDKVFAVMILLMMGLMFASIFYLFVWVYRYVRYRGSASQGITPSALGSISPM